VPLRKERKKILARTRQSKFWCNSSAHRLVNFDRRNRWAKPMKERKKRRRVEKKGRKMCFVCWEGNSASIQSSGSKKGPAARDDATTREGTESS